ncbi:MAG: DUF86 domain-containing protein [Cyanobacteria bacterium]|nr:DUF86 domain-containing protein [Cyanobacteriota bacterium]
MSPIDRAVLAERTAAITRHLDRVASRLPSEASGLVAATDTSDAVILHLWQATQGAIDLAVSASVQLGYGSPSTYAEAFRLLQHKGVIEQALADKLVRAAGFRNIVAHAYDALDMGRVYRAAKEGPADLRAFLQALARIVSEERHG